MPSVTHAESPTPSPGKKRRRDDNGAVQTPIRTSTPPMTSIQHAQGAVNSANFDNNDRLVFHRASPNRGLSGAVFNLQRKILPIPSSKRARISEFDENEDREVVSPHEEARDYDFSHSHPVQSTSLSSASTQSRPTGARTNSTALLSPCHICHRKPTKKSDLDSFAECLGCGQQTCYVCIRQCQGWLPSGQASEEPPLTTQDLSASFTMHDADDDEAEAEEQTVSDRPGGDTGSNDEHGWSGSGHRSVICSRCCVERGSEGDVVCLGCLAGIPLTG